MNEEVDTLIDELWEEIKKKVPKEFFVVQVVKTMEELGEIADLALRDHGRMRKDKVISKEELKEKLGEELADAFICLLMIAKNQGIDIKKRLTEKTKIEIKRWRKEYNIKNN